MLVDPTLVTLALSVVFVGSGLTTLTITVLVGAVGRIIEVIVGEAVVIVAVDISVFVCLCVSVCITVIPASKEDEADAPEPPSTGTTEYVGLGTRRSIPCGSLLEKNGRACVADGCWVRRRNIERRSGDGRARRRILHR